LKLPVRPTAVLASNDLTAVGIMGAIYAAGLKVPDDISVVGFDDIALSSFMAPPLTTIRLSRAEIAEFAFNSLYTASQRGESEGVTHVVRAELVVRQSTAAVRTEREIKNVSPALRPGRDENWAFETGA
jgi:DNA-binding LacI/PurR family transcriptional regulator